MQYLARLALAASACCAFSQAHAVAVDLGAANGFSAITFGNFTGYRGDTGSLLGVGGNASLTNWTVNDYALPGYAGYSMIVGGNFTGNSGVVQGNSFVGGTTTLSAFNAGTVSTGSSPLDFGTLKSQLSSTSLSTAGTAATGSVDYQGGSTLLTGNNQAVEVFSINGSELSNDSFLTAASGIRSDATVILNISGSSVNMRSFGIDLPGLDPLAPGQQPTLNLLLNFYEATQLSFANVAVEGAVLAPFANVTGTSGHIGGTFVAQSFLSGEAGNFEFHDIHFKPVDVPPSAVPEPEQWAMYGAGLVMLLTMLRRQRSAAVKQPSLRPA